MSTLAYYGSYVWIVWRTIAGVITLGDMTMFLAIFRQSQSSIQIPARQLNRLYESNLFLDNLITYLALQPLPVNAAVVSIAPTRFARASNSGTYPFATPARISMCCEISTCTSSRRAPGAGRAQRGRQDDPDQAADPAL